MLSHTNRHRYPKIVSSMNEILTRHKTVPVLHDTDSRVFLLNGLICVRKWFLNSGYHFIAASKMIYCRFNILVRTCIVHFVTCINTGTNILICQGQGSRLLGSCNVWYDQLQFACSVLTSGICTTRKGTPTKQQKKNEICLSPTHFHTQTQ